MRRERTAHRAGLAEPVGVPKCHVSATKRGEARGPVLATASNLTKGQGNKIGEARAARDR